jgi:hypothetical protein
MSLVSDYFATVSEMPVFPPIAGGQIANRLEDLPIDPTPVDQLFEDCRAIIAGSWHRRLIRQAFSLISLLRL